MVFFVLVAPMLVAVYLSAKTHEWWPAVVYCAIVTLCALALLQRRAERRCPEWFFGVLLLVMPVTGYLVAHVDWFWSGHAVPRAGLAAVMGGIAAPLLAVGVARRGRIELAAGFITLVAAIVELQLLVEIAYEAKLIWGGVVLIAFAWLVSRLLRGRERGFVVTRSAYSRYDVAHAHRRDRRSRAAARRRSRCAAARIGRRFVRRSRSERRFLITSPR